MIYQMVMTLTLLCQLTRSALYPGMSLRSALHTLFCCRICTCEGLLFSVSNRAFAGLPSISLLYPTLEHILAVDFITFPM